MRIDTSRLIVFSVAFAAVAVLVGLGKVDSKYLEMAIVWLAASVDGKLITGKKDESTSGL